MRPFIVKAKLAVIALAASALTIGFLLSTQSPAVAAVAEDAAITFKTKCAVCHGTDGSANTAQGKALKVRDLRSAEVQKMTDAKMTDVIVKGKGKMPALGKSMSQDQVKQLVAHIRGMAKKG